MTFILFSICSPIYIPINSGGGFLFLQSLQHFLFVDFFDNGHSDQWNNNTVYKC